MELNEYQKEAAKNAEYKKLETVGGLLYTTLDLSSKTGKFVDGIKDILEKKDGKINVEDKSTLVKELGDLLLCVSHIADELFITLDDVALLNIQKVQRECPQILFTDEDSQT